MLLRFANLRGRSGLHSLDQIETRCDQVKSTKLGWVPTTTFEPIATKFEGEVTKSRSVSPKRPKWVCWKTSQKRLCSSADLQLFSNDFPLRRAARGELLPSGRFARYGLCGRYGILCVGMNRMLVLPSGHGAASTR